MKYAYAYVLDKELCDMLLENGVKPLSIIGSGDKQIWIFENSDCFNNFLSKRTLSQRQKLRFSNQLKMQF